jgi:serine/threonine-protein kinase RsbW
MSTSRLSLKLANQLPEIHRMTAALEQFCAERGIPEDVCFQVTLVLDELVTNVVNYAFDGGEHEIVVEIEHAADGVRAEIVDGGREFDPLQRPPPDLTSSLEDRPVGGLGIHYLRTLMQDIEYRRIEGRNHLRFAKKLEKAA